MDLVIYNVVGSAEMPLGQVHYCTAGLCSCIICSPDARYSHIGSQLCRISFRNLAIHHKLCLGKHMYHATSEFGIRAAVLCTSKREKKTHLEFTCPFITAVALKHLLKNTVIVGLSVCMMLNFLNIWKDL